MEVKYGRQRSESTADHDCSVAMSIVHNLSFILTEIFCDLSGMPGDFTEFGRKIRAKVLKHTGIPVGVGIAHTSKGGTCAASHA